MPNEKSRFLSLVLTLSVLAALFLPVSASALEEPALNCTHAVLLDANYNEVLYEKGAYEKAYPASITKVMTALLVLEAIQEGKFAPDTPITPPPRPPRSRKGAPPPISRRERC